MKVTTLDNTALGFLIFSHAKPDTLVTTRTHEQFASFHREERLAKTRFIVPAPVLSELLVNYHDQSTRKKVHRLISSMFDIIPLDEQAAAIASDIWIAANQHEVKRRLKEEFDISKQLLKVDISIVAIAKANGSKCLISTEKHSLPSCAALVDIECIHPDNCKPNQDGRNLFDGQESTE